MQLHMTLATRDVDRVLCDAESDRRAGCLSDDATVLREKLAEALAEIRELNSADMKTLRRDLERAENKISRLEDEVAEAEEERDEERDRANDLDDELATAKETIEELEARVKELEEEAA